MPGPEASRRFRRLVPELKGSRARSLVGRYERLLTQLTMVLVNRSAVRLSDQRAVRGSENCGGKQADHCAMRQTDHGEMR